MNAFKVVRHMLPICAGAKYITVHNTHMYCSYVIVNTYNGLRLGREGGPFCRLFERMRVSTHTTKLLRQSPHEACFVAHINFLRDCRDFGTMSPREQCSCMSTP